MRPLPWLALLLLPWTAFAAAPAASAATATAVFAGGCFWCLESDFEKLPGVISAVSGYAGGRGVNPSYEQVSAGGSGHYEVVEVAYDPARVSYDQLLDYFWRHVDPLDGGGQFCDRGEQYRSAIFAATAAEQQAATRSREALAARFKAPIATPVLPAAKFWPAEAYHQDYYKKSALKYRYYRYSCGRDQRVQELWDRAKP
jgi:methionine-S-sulfoxide reductase